MNQRNFKVLKERVAQDDCTLMEMFKKSKEETFSKKRIFEYKLFHKNENDYLSLTLAKLAYEFAIEEHNALSYEINQRGLHA